MEYAHGVCHGIPASSQACWPLAGVTHKRVDANLAEDVQPAGLIGAAISTATLATIFYQVLTRTRHDYSVAVSDALLAAGSSMLLALLMAPAELRRRRWHRTASHGWPERLPHDM